MYFIQSILQIFFPVIFSTSPLLLFSCYFFSCYFFSYFPTVTFFPVTFFLLLFFRYFFSCYFLSYNHYWYVKMPRCGYVEHGLEHFSFYVQKHTAHLAACYGPPAGLRWAARGARISETLVFRNWNQNCKVWNWNWKVESKGNWRCHFDSQIFYHKFKFIPPIAKTSFKPNFQQDHG